jgi:putative membrane protein
MRRRPGQEDLMPRNRLVAFLVELAVSAAVLWLGVAWVSRDNPRNTFLRAVLVSLGLTVAYVLTGGRFWLHLLVIPWLIYAAIWLAVIKANYGLGFLHSLLLAVALTVLTWLAEWILGVPSLR